MKKFEVPEVVEISGKELVRKGKVLDMLKDKMEMNEKRYEKADNDDERRKLQYQWEELKIIYENIENM